MIQFYNMVDHSNWSCFIPEFQFFPFQSFFSFHLTQTLNLLSMVQETYKVEKKSREDG